MMPNTVCKGDASGFAAKSASTGSGILKPKKFFFTFSLSYVIIEPNDHPRKESAHGNRNRRKPDFVRRIYHEKL